MHVNEMLEVLAIWFIKAYIPTQPGMFLKENDERLTKSTDSINVAELKLPVQQQGTAEE